MFVDERTIRESLVRMIRKLTANSALREDLLQEALVHLWLTEAGRPSQTKSWYLQSCKYHLLHYLASGRSVDSAKRRNGQLDVGQDSYEDGLPDNDDSGNSVLNSVSARDIIALLTPQLSTQERKVLDCFADGMGPREIGRKLRMSHTMVIRHRRRIATLYTRLDVDGSNPFPHLNGTNGHRKKRHATLLTPKPAHIVNGNRNGNGNGNGNGHSARV